MNPRHVSTGPIGGNQERIDELEYFIECIGRHLFGGEGEDFRRLRDYTPCTRNMSALMDSFSAGDRNIAEDLRFLVAELDARAAVASTGADIGDVKTVFRYARYQELARRPERLLEAVPPEGRIDVANLLAAGPKPFARMLSQLSAYAWLCVVGIPHLEAELNEPTRGRIELVDWGGDMMMGLARILGSSQLEMSRGVSAYFDAAQHELYDEYRGQLARYAARTQPL